jgi:golgin subfamily B member 1
LDFLGNKWVSYSGEFRNNSMHGLGTLILSNGEKFLGSFAGGKVHGEGTFYRLSGDI